jgi:hypothetical protein
MGSRLGPTAPGPSDYLSFTKSPWFDGCLGVEPRRDHFG